MTMPSAGFGGLFTDLVTPFRGDEVDLVGLRMLIEWQVACGVSGIVVCGEAGEASMLSETDRAALVSAAIDAAAGRVPVLVGTGTNATDGTIALTRQALSLGANAAVIVTPYYSKPTQEGLFRHVQAVTDAVDLPVIVVNRPRHTAVDISPALLARFATLPGILGFADYSGEVSRPALVAERNRIPFYSGDDRTALALGLMGACGAFSLAANVAPRLVSSMHHAFRHGNLPAARALQQTLHPLFSAIEEEQGVVATKQALAFVLGLSPEVRLPLTPASDKSCDDIRNALSLLAVTGRHGRADMPGSRRTY